MKKGRVFVISAPSGTGKTTVISRFLKKHKRDFKLSVSVTTRNPRKGEKYGKDYYFYKKERFRKEIKQGRFLEFASVVGNYYGTLKKTVEDSVKRGKNVIMDIDVQGAAKIRGKKKDCVTVFIMPPSFKELERRLQKRRTDTKENINKRLKLARHELKQRDKYNYVIVNKDIKEAVKYLECIYKLEKFKKMKI